MSDSSAHPSQSNPLGGNVEMRPPVQIRLVHLLYCIAMLAASMATFGPFAIPLGLGIIAFWAWVFLGANRPKRLAQALASIFLVLFFLCCMSLLTGYTPRSAARRMYCINNLKQIAIALHNYYGDYKSLPPAFIADANGRPMHSWRVLILPYIEEQARYEKYRFDEPWDSPHNLSLAANMPEVYRCPSDDRTNPNDGVLTSYVAVVGTETAWPLGKGRTFGEVVDGTSNTLLVMESQRKAIHWMEPSDLTFEEAVAAFSSPRLEDYGHMREGFFHDEATGRNVAIADGSVRFVGNLPREVAEQLIGVDNGPPDDLDDASKGQPHYRRANYGNWFRLAIFMLLLFLPLPWVWIPSGQSSRKSVGSA